MKIGFALRCLPGLVALAGGWWLSGATRADADTFFLGSSAVAAGGALPVEFTGDGAGISPPLEWRGAPEGTKGFALIMHHIDPEGRTKWYWTLYNIPADVRELPKGAQGVGTAGSNSVNHDLGYAPPHSKGPGAKIYVLTVYALSAPVQVSNSPAEVNRDGLLAAMKDITLASAELKVNYTRPAGEVEPGKPRAAGDPSARKGKRLP